MLVATRQLGGELGESSKCGSFEQHKFEVPANVQLVHCGEQMQHGAGEVTPEAFDP
jgi:hypothetical protein